MLAHTVTIRALPSFLGLLSFWNECEDAVVLCILYH